MKENKREKKEKNGIEKKRNEMIKKKRKIAIIVDVWNFSFSRSRSLIAFRI